MKKTQLIILLILITKVLYAQTTHYVTSSADAGDGTLRYCIENSISGDKIAFTYDMTINLESPLVIQNKSLLINTNGYYHEINIDGSIYSTSYPKLLYINLTSGSNTVEFSGGFVFKNSNVTPVTTETNSTSNVIFKFCTFSNNNFYGDYDDSNFTGNIYFEYCSFNDNGGEPISVVGEYDIIKFSQCSFNNNTQGALNISGTSFSFNGCHFNNNNLTNTSEYSGAITAEHIASIELKYCDFDNNKTDNFWGGGAVRIFADTCIISNTSFNNNESIDNGAVGGGALWVMNASLTYCHLENNISYSYAGAFYAINSTISNSHFVNNQSLSTNWGGGAAYIKNSTIEDCNFRYNKANSNGGAITTKESCTVKNSVFRYNSTIKIENSPDEQYGGAIYIEERNASDLQNTIVDDCNFYGNKADNGGALYGKVKHIIDCEFEKDTATYWAGALYFGSDSIINCKFIANHAKHTGAIVLDVNNNEGNILNCEFLRNFSENNCGAIEIMGNGFDNINDGFFRIYNCSFIGNIANNGDGGGILSWVGEGIVYNSIFIGNTASHYGGGIASDNTQYAHTEYKVINCTFSNNDAVNYKDCYLHSTDIAYNCIFNSLNQNMVPSRYFYCAYSLYGYNSYNNNVNYVIDYNPFSSILSKGSDDIWGTNDDNINVRIKSESGLINSGNQVYLPVVDETDYYGNQRLNAGQVDIGAAEYNVGDIYVHYADTLRFLINDIVDFGTVEAQVGTRAKNFIITNGSNSNITIQSINSSNSNFSINYDNNVLEPNESFEQKISFSPQTIGSYTPEISINYSDSKNYKFKVDGEGIL